MVKCAKCGEDIEEEVNPAGIAGGSLSYHVVCAPRDLLTDAVTEWKAILGRGMQYFVDKYLPREARPASLGPLSRKAANEERLLAYADIFAKMGEKFKKETESRG